MQLQFIKHTYHAEYRDPTDKFNLTKIPFEIRHDPLTKRSTRIFPIPKFKLPAYDWKSVVQKSLENFCPFCPHTLERATPRFPENFVPGGRFKVGEAVVVPNLFPNELYTGIVIISSKHYIPLTDFSAPLLVDGFKASLKFIKRAHEFDPKNTIFASVNWNYMPPAGASIVHPHLQTLVGPHPSNRLQLLYNASNQYLNSQKSIFWQNLVEQEKEIGQRYLAQTGRLHWLTAFAPRSVVDVIVVFDKCTTIDDIDEQILNNFASGLLSIFKYIESINIPSFNLSFFPSTQRMPGYWINARIVGRFNLPPLGGSEINYLQMLHDNPWAVKPPEDVALELKPYLTNIV